MSEFNLQEKTVLELRKLAREKGVKLGAGVNKAEIIARLAEAIGKAEQQLEISMEAPAPETPAPAAPQPEKPERQQQFRAAWHNPSTRYNNPPQRTGFGPQRQPANGFGPQAGQPGRPANQYAPRFGPAPSVREAEPLRPQESEQHPQESYYRPAAPQQTQRFAGPRTGYGPQTRREGPPVADADPGALVSPAEMIPGEGRLEIHPEGYGFLRVSGYAACSRDIYISVAQIRRYGLRAGDRVTGQVRPQREGEKFSAMILVEQVNGKPAEEGQQRPFFDDLTPIYPRKRIDLGSDYADLRLVDLLAPLGFGQRCLFLCPPECGRSALLAHLASAIAKQQPETEVVAVLLDENPEDVTLFQDQAHCTVVATTFDQPPETHLRVTDLVLESSMRKVEQGRDVVLIIDSLTKLSKTTTTAAAQQGRALPGMVNPASLYRTKKMFGAARCLREGGSLTVIGMMNVEGVSKVDDTIVEEFRGAANMILVMDSAQVKAGVVPPVNPFLTGTKHSELLLTEAQQSSMPLLRSTMTGLSAQAAVAQLQDMIAKTGSNDELLKRLPDWLSLMQGARQV